MLVQPEICLRGFNGITRADQNTQKLEDHGNWFSERSIPIDPLPLKENPRLKEEKVVSLSIPWLERPVSHDGKVASSPPVAGPEGELCRPRQEYQGVP